MQPCPVCNSQSTRLKFSLTYNVFQCNNCGFQFCPGASFDKSFLSGLNEETREKALRLVRKENFKRITTSIKKHNPKCVIGLEVGCSYGWFLESCKENSIECIGIEPETRFNEFYTKGGYSVKNGFYPDEIPTNSKFDFIAFNDVFEHLPDLNSTMSANYTLLNEKGLLILNLPIQGGLVYSISKLAYFLGVKSFLNRMWQFNFHSPHLSYFTKKSLLNFVTLSNFEVVESYKLKTINFFEISNRIKQDNKQAHFRFYLTYMGVLALYPFFQLFPDTYCFVFRKF